MITISIDNESGVTISVEGTNERLIMAEHYAENDQPDDVDFDQSDFDQALPPGVPAIVAEDPAITIAPDSGEPELEAEDPVPDVTLWHLSGEELQSLKLAEYERGREDGRRELETVTTERALRIIASELDNKLRTEGAYGSATPTRGEVFGVFAIELAKRLGWTVNA